MTVTTDELTRLEAASFRQQATLAALQKKAATLKTALKRKPLKLRNRAELLEAAKVEAALSGRSVEAVRRELVNAVSGTAPN